MQSIVLKNFKSYEAQALNDLNSRINVVVGSNGQGKSNFFKAISFLFTDKFTINRAQFNATLYVTFSLSYKRGAKVQNPEILVQVNFSQKDEEKKPFRISKSWTNYTNEDLKINDKSKNKSEYENFIQSFGLSYTSPYNIVQQGKISQIAQMTENQLYLLLEDTAGVKRFMKKQQEAQSKLTKIQTDLNEVEELLKFLKQKMGQVEDKKNEYEFYSVEQKVRKIKKKRELNNYITGIDKTLQTLKEKHLSVLKEVEETRVKQKDLLWQIEENERNLQVITQKTLFYEKEQSEGIEVSSPISKKSISSKKKQLKNLEKKLEHLQATLRKDEEKLSMWQKELSVYREKYQMIKIDIELQGQSKDSKKLKEGYQSKIVAEKESITGFEEEIKKLTKVQAEFKPISYTNEVKQLTTLELQLAPVLDQSKKLRVQQIEIGRNKMNIECEIHALMGRKKNLDDLVKKLLPMIDFRLLKWLAQSKIDGIYGYLIEHLKIDSNVAFAYELAGLQKLCTLLVEDDKVAAKVVEANKKIHGKNINILPLSFVKTQATEKRSIPSMDNVYSLINKDWISCVGSEKITGQVKSNVQKIIQNTFSKYALVEDYTTALKVSKDYNLNCITADREIVYSDAYMCKVGREEIYEKGKIQLFEMLHNMNKQLLTHQTSLKNIEKKEVELQNQQIQLINKKDKLQLRINQLQKTIEDAKKIQNVIQKLEQKKVTLHESIQRCKKTIQQFEKVMENMQKNVKSRFKVEDFKQAESQYFEQKTKVQQLVNQNYEKEKEISTLMKDLQSFNKQIATFQLKEPSLDLLSKEQILKDLENEKRRLEQRFLELNKELNKLAETKSLVKEKQSMMLAELTVEEQNQKDILNKIENLRDVKQQEEDQIQEISNTLSRKLPADSILNRKRMFYTARDKVFFAKISEYIDKVALYSESTKNIRTQKEKLQKYIERTQTEAKKYMKFFISNFEKHFIRYFLRIVPNGKAELKTKIYSQKIKGITKNGYSLEMKVSFNEEEGIRKWSEFSGGQKTVLSLCIILAIQKCEPTPFCVLDEVDAALDPFYAEKIVDIIAQESETCQYFISSFKKSMLDFPQRITNYYLAKNVNRISTLTKVDKAEIENFINEIAE